MKKYLPGQYAFSVMTKIILMGGGIKIKIAKKWCHLAYFISIKITIILNLPKKLSNPFQCNNLTVQYCKVDLECWKWQSCWSKN
jgi:hypothetical protein